MKVLTWFLSVITSAAIVSLLQFGSPFRIVYFQKVLRSQRIEIGQSFQIHVLTWNRPDSFERLLRSLNSSSYDGDHLDLFIHIDGGGGEKTKAIARKFHWPHGKKHVLQSEVNMGLALSWFNAWRPKSLKEQAIIFEDDIVVSPLWYQWLKRAWAAYKEIPDLAGISLMRQSLVPKGAKVTKFEIVNNHEPFLYKLVGSTGFSPHPGHWKNFTDWIHSVDYTKIDVFVPGLITSLWWRGQNKTSMWTQHFIYFCSKNELYTLYINLPNGTTLASNMQEPGLHFDGSKGADFSSGQKRVL